jgi:zeaxanthin glucosyltransferase
MSRIVFMVDLEPGHIIPTFPLAQSLKDANYDIVYMGFVDAKDLIQNAGFNFYPFFENHYPKGFINEYKKIVIDDHQRGYDRHFKDLCGEYFNTVINEIKPDLFIISSFLSIEMLILYYKYNIKPIILSPRLYKPNAQFAEICTEEIYNLPADVSILLINILAEKKLKYSSFIQLVEPVNHFYHFIICSQALEINTLELNANIFYIGSGVSKPTNHQYQPEVEYPGKIIIYASMGSQSQIYNEKFRLLFLKMKNIMRSDQMKSFHLIFSLGGNQSILEGIDTIDLINITLVEWINQIAVLERSGIAVIHGGLNTLKECIYFKIPMIIIPGSRDQLDNTKLIAYHSLGKEIDIHHISENELTELIINTLNDKNIKQNLENMRNKFLLLDSQNVGVSVIDQIFFARNLAKSS